MDCSACRSTFSESFDGRLADVRRQEFLVHLRACRECESEFALYRRVFSALATLPDGAPPPFRVPSEVPGAFAAPARPASPPAFARIAAGILLLVGLVGTHVLVFQWSRDRASRDPRPPVAPPVASLAQATMPGILPSSLRDHVEATDLFIRQAARSAHLPEMAEVRDLAEADWATSNLAKLTAELRDVSYEGAGDRAQIEGYLRASEDFVARTRRLIESPRTPGGVRAICDAAGQSGIVRHLEVMKPVVAPLSLGTSFTVRQPTAPAVMRLSPDGQLILEAKRCRLAGQLSQAIDGFREFGQKYPKSRLGPIAVYLHQDTLLKAGRYVDAKRLSGGNDQWLEQFSIRIQVNDGGYGMWWDQDGQQRVVRVFQITRIPTTPMKSEVFVRPLVDDLGAPEPPRR
jgi:hypothetical protein